MLVREREFNGVAGLPVLLGGLAITHFGDYNWMWYADIVLAAGAALINLPIREPAVVKPAVA